MAKSQESFSKREKEKKRLKKRQEKQKKKEERKAANAESGSSLDDMIAYVDENGNSTGYDDVYTRLEKYRNHFDAVGWAVPYRIRKCGGSFRAGKRSSVS